MYHKTTDRHHCFTRHPNLLKAWPQQIRASEQLWVADITYFPTHGKFICLSLVKDAYSKKIVGWHVHESLQTEEVAQAMKMALPGGAVASNSCITPSEASSITRRTTGPAQAPRRDLLDD